MKTIEIEYFDNPMSDTPWRAILNKKHIVSFCEENTFEGFSVINLLGAPPLYIKLSLEEFKELIK